MFGFDGEAHHHAAALLGVVTAACGAGTPAPAELDGASARRVEQPPSPSPDGARAAADTADGSHEPDANGALQPPAETAAWDIADTREIAGRSLTKLGAPEVRATEQGQAVCFDGARDGLVLEENPLAGLERFTIQVLFRPDPEGEAEQRFVHVQENESDDRALIETRLLPDGAWYLDTFLRHGDVGLTLKEESRLHRTGSWYWAALTYDGATMRHFVEGVEEASGSIEFEPLAEGRMSLGVRLNRVSWFKGCIRALAISPRALEAGELQRVQPGGAD
jgi:hypothetical protein